ncbi:MAG TPA: TrbC/VirB2 family protein [Candidatus Paceibacterota bacterium]|nr:TrbC/VirB2 family protein [Candidatus Paceibacterota bacterium]
MKAKIFYKILINATVLSVLALPFFIYADAPGVGSDSLNPLGSNTGSLEQFVTNIIKVLLNIAIPITALAIVYIGFWFVTAKGNPGELSKAKDALLWTLVGFAILLGARAIVGIISSTVTGLGA